MAELAIQSLTGRRLALWLALGGPPLSFLTNLQIAYSLAPVACAHGGNSIIHAVSAAMLLVCVASGLVALFLLRSAGQRGTEHIDQVRFMALIAIAEAALFTLTNLGLWLAPFLMSACQR
jgi:hypothetical protein